MSSSRVGKNAIAHHASSSASVSSKRLNYCGHGGKRSGSGADQKRVKAIPWTEQEHRLFLIGLKKFGKDDWESISRNSLISKTPAQVASHAQKYFARKSMLGERRGSRTRTHDIITTTVDNGNVLPELSRHQQLPITAAQQNKISGPSAATAIGGGGGPQSAKHRAQPHIQQKLRIISRL